MEIRASAGQHQLSIGRLVAAAGVLMAVAGAVVYQALVSELIELISFPVALCVGMVVWGLFQVRPAFVATMIAALAFALVTVGGTYFVQMDTRVLRMVNFIYVAAGQVGIVVLGFCSAALAWSAARQRARETASANGLNSQPAP